MEKAPVQVKKNKKKAKAIVRPVISVFTCDETEPDAGEERHSMMYTLIHTSTLTRQQPHSPDE